MGKKGGGGSVVGYKYSLSMLMGLCRGPVDSIAGIKVGDLAVFEGRSVDNERLRIDKPELFGGKEKEGGIDGTLDVMMGAPDQDTTASFYRTIMPGRLSSLRGVVTCFFDGLVAANNPYLKKWEFRVRRAKNGWHGGTAWYPEEAIIALDDGNGNAIHAMNPAHIVYECLTNPVWGRGLPTARLDEDSFISCANQLCLEQFGLCLAWARNTEISEFIQQVFNHIGGGMYLDRTTGLITMRLLRKNYNIDDLPVFTYDSGLLRIDDDDTTSPDNSHSEIVVKFTDPVSNSPREVRVQNLAGTQTNQSVTSTSVEYVGIPTAGLASRAAQRDLSMQAPGLKRYKLKLDRRGRKLSPFGVFRISVPDRGIDDMILRVGTIEEGPVTDQALTVVAMQDVFSLEDTTYVVIPDATWEPPDRSLRVITRRRVDEVVYRDLARSLTTADLATLTPDQGDVITMASPPTTLSLSYELWTAATAEAYVDKGSCLWTPNAVTTTELGYYDTSVTIDLSTAFGADDLGDDLPQVAWIEYEVAAEVTSYELVEVTAFDSETGVLTIGRGCVDTIPAPHPIGVRIWFPENAVGADTREYTLGEDVRVKMLTRTNTGLLPLASAVEDTQTIVARQGKPYPAGDFQIDGEPFANVTESTGTDTVFTWAHRDRITQADHVLVHGDASTGPETAVTYELEVYEFGGSLLRATTGITADNFTYDGTMFAADGAPPHITIKHRSERDGFLSFQEYEWSMYKVATGYGRGYGVRYGGG